MYKYYPDEIIEEIRISNDIVDVIGEYIKLEKKVKYFFGLCPFHKEKTPSFSVTPSKQIFYCYGCGKGGNVIHFIMGLEKLDYADALRYLADRARIQLPEGESREEKEKAGLKQEIIKINTETARFFFKNLNLKKYEKAIQYLKNRNITGHTVKTFGIGYSPEERDVLYKYLSERGFNEEFILKSGLVISGKSGGYYDRFKGRLIFPIFDVRGNVIGFGGRVLDDSTPKYINSPETAAYNKGRNLYALNFAKNSGEKRIVVVEGYMDVISLHQGGIINTVASLGTSLTESQGRILKKYAEEIIISFDADTAGQAAAMRGLDLLDDMGCNVKVLVIPRGKDPDEFIRENGADELRKLVDSSISLIEYKIRVLKKQVNTSTIDGKINFLNKAADLLAKIDNRVEIEMYIKKMAKDYEIMEESIYSEVLKRIKPKTGLKQIVIDTGRNREAIKRTNDNLNKDLIHCERMLLALLCIDNGVYKLIKEKVNPGYFADDEVRRVSEIVFDRLEDNKDIMTGELLSLLNQETANEFAGIIQKECNCEDNQKAVMDIIKRMEIYKLDERKREILGLLGNKNGLLERDVEKLTLELNTIIKKKKSI